MYHRTVKLSFKSFMLALLAVMLMAIAVSAQTTSSTAAFDVQVRGHLTRPQMFCPSGATLCGTAYIEGYGNAEYGWFLFDTSGPSGSCGPHSGLFDYRALVRFTLPDGSTLTLQEVGTLCSAGNSFPTGGLNSYGNPLFFDAYWQVVSAEGQFAGLIGNGTSRGTFAGAAIDTRYGGTLNVGSNEATLRLSWDILRNGALATCEEVGASHVRLKLLGIGSTMETEFDCNQKSGEVVTNAGTYMVEIELVDSAGTRLSQVRSTVELFIGDVYDLGNYQFSFAF